MYTDLQELSKKTHKIKGAPVAVAFEQFDRGPPPLVRDSGEEDEGGPVTIVVGNVPRTVSMENLKAFFESDNSGGCDGAVADIRTIEPGVFHVSFHNHNGEMGRHETLYRFGV